MNPKTANQSQTHYEQAFEAFLRRRRIHYVALNQTRKAILSGISVKSFDFLIYPPHQPRIISDLKGRKFSYSAFQRGRLGQSWATAADVEGLKCWQEIFGREYWAVFIFAYWLCGEPEPGRLNRNQQVDQLSAVITAPFSFKQRLYAFTVVELNAYRLGMRLRSTRWNTVFVPSRLFRHLAQSFDSFVHPIRL